MLYSAENGEQVVEDLEAVRVALGVSMRCRILVSRGFYDGQYRSVLPYPTEPDLAGQPFTDGLTTRQVSGDSAAYAGQGVHGEGTRRRLVQPSSEERDDCVTAVFVTGWQRALAAHWPSMTRSPTGHRDQILSAACADDHARR